MAGKVEKRVDVVLHAQMSKALFLTGNGAKTIKEVGLRQQVLG